MDTKLASMLLCSMYAFGGCTLNYSVELIQANADRGAQTDDAVDDNDTMAPSNSTDADLKIPAL